MPRLRTDHRDATVIELNWDGQLRRALVMPSPYGQDDYAVFDTQSGELLLHASDDFVTNNGLRRGGPDRFA